MLLRRQMWKMTFCGMVRLARRTFLYHPRAGKLGRIVLSYRTKNLNQICHWDCVCRLRLIYFCEPQNLSSIYHHSRWSLRHTSTYSLLQARKVKCSKEHPICSNCVKLGILCDRTSKKFRFIDVTERSKSSKVLEFSSYADHTQHGHHCPALPWRVAPYGVPVVECSWSPESMHDGADSSSDQAPSRYRMHHVYTSLEQITAEQQLEEVTGLERICKYLLTSLTKAYCWIVRVISWRDESIRLLKSNRRVNISSQHSIARQQHHLW